MSNRIYIADDDKKISELLITHLENNGYDVTGFLDGQNLLDAFNNNPCDLIITDIIMPGLNGYDLCKEIRKTSNVPIIMISANNDEIDRVLGLELGGDDYIGKPISFRELIIKTKNLLKRTETCQEISDKNILANDDLVLNIMSHTVTVNGNLLSVTPKEFGLLELFLSNKNRAFSREQIIEHVWKYDFAGDARQVDHLIKRLRKKMLEANAQCHIQTVWGIGYKIGDENNNEA